MRSGAERLIDGLLEATIVGSFTLVGPAVRRRFAQWGDDEAMSPGSLDGEVVVVTGGTSGLGRAAAVMLGRLGAAVEVVGRDVERGEQVVADLDDVGATGRMRHADLADNDSVRELVDALAADHGRIRAVVHSAGALLPERRLNGAGVEITWASMVVGPHLLTRLLADRLDRAVWVSSGGMYAQAVDLDDLSWERRQWSGSKAYAQAKRAQVDLVAEAAERGESPLQVAMHPGWADTPGVEASLPGFRKVMGPLLRTPECGADTIVWLTAASGERLDPGAFYLDRRPRGTVRWPGTATSTADRVLLRSIVDTQAALT
ncbi:MAG: SDR family NAD(P)-dependent oxidoreductase [Actinomycetota bacterium]|nr:SDR family NAD(P)-dependent oxidoreductase [Actinomycetota bacterium]